MTRRQSRPPALESLIESEKLGLEVLHPGGLDITRELAELCRVRRDATVLDVASGTGASACYLAEHFGCRVTGLDASESMVERARRNAAERGLNLEFRRGDAHDLPFAENSFDAVISECTTCVLDKARAIGEMTRVATAGGYVGIHDLCWREGTPERLKRRLVELEGERPETLEGWTRLFENAGLRDVIAVDRSHVVPDWMREAKRRLGLRGQAKLLLTVVGRWGFGGYRRVRESTAIFQNPDTGYGLIVGRKP